MQAPVIILLNTQLGENIGMCARAMLNCGLEQLRLVNPRDGWPNPSARASAADADQILDSITCHGSLEDAISDCHRLFATTARSRSLQVPSIPLSEAIEEITLNSQEASSQKAAILFGPEASGLDNEALSRADALIHYPMNPDFNSLNLAQAVLLLGWEWRKAFLMSGPDAAAGESTTVRQSPAPRSKLNEFLDRLESELDQGGFFLTPELRPDTVRNLRTIFTRSSPSEQEINMLHGIITSLKKPPDRL